MECLSKLVELRLDVGDVLREVTVTEAERKYQRQVLTAVARALVHKWQSRTAGTSHHLTTTTDSHRSVTQLDSRSTGQ